VSPSTPAAAHERLVRQMGGGRGALGDPQFDVEEREYEAADPQAGTASATTVS